MPRTLIEEAKQKLREIEKSKETEDTRYKTRIAQLNEERELILKTLPCDILRRNGGEWPEDFEAQIILRFGYEDKIRPTLLDLNQKMLANIGNLLLIIHSYQKLVSTGVHHEVTDYYLGRITEGLHIEDERRLAAAQVRLWLFPYLFLEKQDASLTSEAILKKGSTIVLPHLQSDELINKIVTFDEGNLRMMVGNEIEDLKKESFGKSIVQLEADYLALEQ
jgi:hypothetical protein